VAPPDAGAVTVEIPFPRDPGTLTPLTFTLGYPLLTLVYDTVTWRDAAGVPRPWLARSLETLDGGRRVVVRLRPGVRWHDGRALTARDVAFTYDLMRERRHPRFAPQLEAIASVRARDARTVEFVLRHPSIGFADQPLADVPILPAHLWRGLRAGLRAPPGAPVGSGPYRFEARRSDGGVSLVAVPDYFRGRPRADRIEVPIVREARDMLARMQRGGADTLPFTLTADQERALEAISVRVERGPLFTGTMLMFNVDRAPFDRVQVRRAIAATLDPRRIAQAAGDSTVATTGPLHPESRWAPQPASPARPAPARSLADLDLPLLRVLAPGNDPVRREAGRQVVLALRRAGADARLVPVFRRDLGRAVGEGGTRPSFDLAIWSIPPLASHDPDYLAASFGRRSAGGVLNRSGYDSPAFDRLARRVRAAPSPAARRAAVADLLAQLARDVPAVPLLFADGAFAYRSTSPVGWAFVAGTGILDKQSLLRSAPARTASLDPAAQVTDSDDGGFGLFGIVGAGMLALALLAAGAAALGRRR
jgi:peptide/nickel transport system substrate-binding protein